MQLGSAAHSGTRGIFRRWIGAAFAGSMLCSMTAVGQLPAENAAKLITKGELRWHNGTVTLEAQRPEAAAAQLSAMPGRHTLVQFTESVTPQDKALLQNSGVELLSYLGDNAWYARVAPTGADAAALQHFGKLRVAQPIGVELKLGGQLLQGEAPQHAILPSFEVIPQLEERRTSKEDFEPTPQDVPGYLTDDTRIAVLVQFHPDVDAASEGAQLAISHGATVRSHIRTVNALTVEMSYGDLLGLVGEDRVMYAEPPIQKFSELNAENRVITGADIAQAAPYSLDGTGVTVLVYDGGTIRTTHQDFGGRATNGDTDGVSDHATHVSGTVGGNGAASGGANRGMAPNVTLVNYGFETGGPLVEGFLYTDPGDMEADYGDAIVNRGADISNNSIGTNTAPNGFDCNTTGNYGLTSAVIDGIVRGSVSNGDPFRIIWANGNERQVSRCLGVEGWPSPYHSTSPPALAKNLIAVGALNEDGMTPASFTSYGPSDDGRIKPDVSAPGVNVLSTSSSSDTSYNTKSGTSMASPTVAGISALILQDFRNQFPGEPDFPNSLLKVWYSHTGLDEIGPEDNRGPDFKYGYGLVQAPDAIDLMRSGNWTMGSVDQGQTYSFLVFVPPGSSEVKVTLAWDDAPAPAAPVGTLVNDLDLQVYDTANNRFYPWTLNLASPGAPAVRTQEDHLNNIEQVVIDAPNPGVYRVDIVGFNVPMGPQAFSVAATPQLINCSSSGVISVDRSSYACSSTATISVVDCDLNTDDNVIETVTVNLASTSEAGGESVLLTETDAATATFIGSIAQATTDAPGVLLIAEGDTITATYNDADNGEGMPQVVTATAGVDCTAPLVTNVAASNIEPRTATVTVDVNEPSQITIHYGTDCNAPTETVSAGGFNTQATFNLSGLDDNTAYYVSVELSDRAGNQSSDNNGGACYSFMTPEVPDFFSEQFTSGGDLAGSAILFAPAGGVDQYTACTFPISVLPTDPTGGTVLPFTTTNATLNVPLGGNQVFIYGQAFTSIFVSDNGYITFSASDTDTTETFADHFDTLRVSAVFDALTVASGAEISYKLLGDRVAVTWLNVRESTTDPGTSTFQVELYYDGRIQIAWLEIDPQDFIAGISDGNGLNPDFFPSDLSGYGFCGPRPPGAVSTSVLAAQDRPRNITLIAGDDGLPETPGALSYTIESLPNFELRDAGNNQVIAAAPYTLVNGGNEVIYESSGGFTGADSFTFSANDGGTPPDGGDSNVATVSITVEPVLELPFVDMFPDTTFDANKWPLVDSATIDGLGLNEPSAPNSARLNADPDGADSITSALIDLSPYALVRLQYWFQQTGGAESPDTNDNLVVEYLDDLGAWQTLMTHLGSEPDMTNYEQVTIELPASALHNSFRVRFRANGTAGAFDDWFVDDVSIADLNSPEASNVSVTTNANTAVDVELDAIDPNGDPIEYIVTSLPASGQLSDPNGGVIAAVPYTLASNGDVVRYTPPFGFQGMVDFAYQATDGPNTSNTATVDITVGGPQPVYTFDFDTNPGWTTDPDWAFGQPTGQGSSGRLDPMSGATGTNVYGYNLNGHYANNIGDVRYLTTTALDFTDVTGVELQFQRWFGMESSSFDHANIQVSNNGTTWTTVWEHTGAAVNESSWSLQTYDISAVADNQSTVYVRWGLGPTDVSVTYQGWNIDDVEFWGLVPLPGGLPGDLNCDGFVSVADIGPFVLALTDPAGYAAQFPDCDPANGDLNEDGFVTVSDIGPFVALLTGG